MVCVQCPHLAAFRHYYQRSLEAFQQWKGKNEKEEKDYEHLNWVRCVVVHDRVLVGVILSMVGCCILTIVSNRSEPFLFCRCSWRSFTQNIPESNYNRMSSAEPRYQHCKFVTAFNSTRKPHRIHQAVQGQATNCVVTNPVITYPPMCVGIALSIPSPVL